jgi:hypothetical protein
MHRFESHMKSVHPSGSRIFKCNSCGIKLKNYHKYHEHYIICPIRRLPSFSAVTPNTSTLTNTLSDSFPYDVEDTDDDESHVCKPFDSLFLKTAHLCLTLIANHRVPAVAIDKIVEHIADVCPFENGKVQLNDLKSSSRLETFKYCFKLISPQPVKMKDCLIGYVLPMRETLHQLLQVPDFANDVFNSKMSDSVATNYHGGLRVQSHPILSDHAALQIIIYVDDIEVCNPLGSARKVHKLTVFYYTLGNISPPLKSSLASIALLAVAKCKDVQHSLEAQKTLLHDCISTIRGLNSGGISFTLQGQHRVVKGDLLCVLGDSLAGNWIGGFKAGFSPVVCRPCHVCETTSVQFIDVARHSECQPRNDIAHRERCDVLCRFKNKTNMKFWSRKFGISRKSVLFDLPSFSVCQGILRDPMHLLFEGLFPLEIRLLLKALSDEGILTLAQVNERISMLHLHYTCVSDKFPLLFSLSDFPMKSAQMWTFATYLPLLISNLIPQQSQQWKSFILLHKISQIITCPFINADLVIHLTDLIAEHHKLFCALYPGSITPKLHFLIHLPQQIIDFGPSRNHWCFRMEAMHQKAKIRQYNFRNICLSVSRHMSLVQSATLFDDQGLPKVLTEHFQPKGSYYHGTVSYDEKLIQGYICSSTSSSSVLFKTSSFIYTDNIFHHTFCQIVSMLVSTEGILYFTLKQCITSYQPHSNTFLVRATLPNLHILPYESLIYPWPMIDNGKEITAKSLFYLATEL